MKRNTVFCVVVALLAAAPTGAQTFGFGAHAGPSVPLSDYAASSGEMGGGALMGYFGGLDLWYPLESVTPALSWYTSLDVVANQADEAVVGRTGTFADGGYLLIPLMTGLRYDIGEAPNLFVTGQAGLVLTRGPDEFYPYGFGDGGPTLGAGFGFNGGLGAQLTERMSVAAKYYPLSGLEFDYEDADSSLEQDVHMLTISFGYSVR
jgi:hypothetical protein